jgi:hypothetical protein
MDKLIRLITEYYELGAIGHSAYIQLIKIVRELQVE